MQIKILVGADKTDDSRKIDLIAKNAASSNKQYTVNKTANGTEITITIEVGAQYLIQSSTGGIVLESITVL